MRVNAYAPVLTVSVFLDGLIAAGGRVVQISTCGVRFPTLFQAYPASKIAMEAFSTSMRQELGLAGVTLSLVRAGAIDTPLMREMKTLPVPAEESRYREYYLRFLERVQKDVGKVIEPEAMAAVVRRALTDRRPRRLYVVNRNRTIRLLSKLPQSLLDKMVRKMVR
jgi:NAD(P)-dependent dehydrogenase (short-subunit alcohol dehydrogenase family)